MNTINIYQIKDIASCKYAFMSWEYAKDKYNINDYEKVASFELGDEYPKLLDIVWIKGNNGELQKVFRMRSISVSDIIEVNGVKYYVDSFGFKEVK